MECQSCGKQKAELIAKDSKLWARAKVLLCKTCIGEKKEPREFIILAARMGIDVTDYVVNRRYCGEELLAVEVLLKK